MLLRSLFWHVENTAHRLLASVTLRLKNNFAYSSTESSQQNVFKQNKSNHLEFSKELLYSGRLT